MRRHDFIIILLIVAATALPAMFSVSRTSGKYKNAEEVREYVMSQLSDDTVSYIAQTVHSMDTLRINNDVACRELYRLVNYVTFAMHKHGDDARSITILRHVLDVLKSSDCRTIDDSRHMIHTYVRLGATFSDMGMSGVALDYYLSGMEQCKDTTYSAYQAMILNNIGILYGSQDFLDKAEEYLKRALEINRRIKDHDGICLNLANLTELYTIKGDKKKAQESAQRSLDYIDHIKYPERLSAMRIQQGELYDELGQHDVAILRYNSALAQYRDDLKDVAGEINATLHISKSYLATNHIDSASLYAERAMTLCRENHRDDDMVATLRTMAAINEANGKRDLALAQMKRLNQLSDSLNGAENRLRLSNWENLNGQLFDGIPMQEDRLSTSELTGFALLTVVTLAAITLVLIYRRRYREAETRTRMAMADHETAISNANRELTSLSIEKIKIHEGVSDVTENLRQVLLELNPKETAKRDRIRSLMTSLNQLSTNDADAEFKLSFERIRPDFYTILSEKYPELTQRDLRLCAFLYLGMTTKEIAGLTYREVRSVESARNRLRKKLNLDLTADLTGHLRSL